MTILPQNVSIDFTDERLTSYAGSLFLSRVAHRLRLPESIRKAIRLKERNRGASDVEMLMSLIYSLCAGDGCLRDVDRLGSDETRQGLLGLEEVPGSRRLGDYLARFDGEGVERLRFAAHEAARKVVPEVVRHEMRTRDYVPLFLDGTGIEVEGEHFEKAGVGYNGAPQYWMHNTFIGSLWVSQQLLPGGVGVTEGWRGLLKEAADLLSDTPSVWTRADNAYYDKEVVNFCRERGWDYSISVTHDTFKRPLIRKAQRLWRDCWAWINDDHTEEAALITHRPGGWAKKESYVVIRSYWEGVQRLLVPRLSFILVSRTDLPIRELILRHRGKMGQENAQKGPLIDLDLHHPPCSRFEANRAFYTAGQIAQILLVATQFRLLPESARGHGLRTIIRDLIRLAGRLVRHARRWTLRLAKTALRLDWLIHAADRLDEWDEAPS
jgi:hypothetical protein